MARIVPVLLAVLLALALPAGGAGVPDGPDARTAGTAAPPEPTPVQENTTRLLRLDEVRATNFTEPERDVVATLDLERDELASTFRSYRFDERLAVSDSRDERVALVRNATDDVERRTAVLRDRQRRALQEYADGSIDAAELVRTLASVDAKAGRLESRLEALRTVPVTDQDLTVRIRHLNSRLALLQGPVRDRVGTAVTGRTESFQLHVSASDDGVVLATLLGERHVREALRVDNEDAEVGGRLSPFEEFRSLMEGLYPWMMNESNHDRFAINGMAPFGNDAMRASVTHSHGQLDVWVDSSTRQVYREDQFKVLGTFPAASTRQQFGTNFVLTVDQTYLGGPLRVGITNQTGAPLDGLVRINGTAVGTTGDDGVLWTLGPPGTFEVTAVQGGDSVTVEAQEVDPRPRASFVPARRSADRRPTRVASG